MTPTAVLLFAGLDSAVLAVAEARRARVHPVYVSTGLAWEAQERAALERLLAAPPLAGCTAPLARLSFLGAEAWKSTEGPDTQRRSRCLRRIVCMTQQCLGRLERVELRNIWTSEAADFTPWLNGPRT